MRGRCAHDVVQGLFYDYMFETGTESELYFAPKFSSAISNDPITGKREHWVSMGLNSKLDGGGLKVFGGRPHLNVVLVLDVSGRCARTTPAPTHAFVLMRCLKHGMQSRRRDRRNEALCCEAGNH